MLNLKILAPTFKACNSLNIITILENFKLKFFCLLVLFNTETFYMFSIFWAPIGFLKQGQFGSSVSYYWSLPHR